MSPRQDLAERRILFQRRNLQRIGQLQRNGVARDCSSEIVHPPVVTQAVVEQGFLLLRRQIFRPEKARFRSELVSRAHAQDVPAISEMGIPMPARGASRVESNRT